jgi:hypothetical protein
MPAERALLRNQGVRHAAVFRVARMLFHDQQVAPHARSRQQDDERDGRIFRRDHRRNHSAFRVADDADFSRIYFGARAQEAQRSLGVAGEVERGRALVDAARFADTTLVVTQQSDALAGQVVGQHQEQFVVENIFIAILWSRTGDQHHRRKRSLAVRDAERAA